MRFNLVINLERISPDVSMVDVLRHTTEMVQMADLAGFDIVWAAEHHALEMTIAPGPFQLLTHFACNTDNVRLGTAVLVPPYWHPIRLAGEAALFDLLSGGRLELGLGRGAYQREFDRVAGGMDQKLGGPMMQEMLPVVKALWAGDVAHDGEYWQFPSATSCPKPLQQPHPPIWVAARDPATYLSAIKQGCSIQSWALTRPFSEVEKYKQQFEDVLAANPDFKRPRFMNMRHTGVFDRPQDADVFVKAIQTQGAQFENLFKNLAPVRNGFPEVPKKELLTNQSEYEAEKLLENLILGSPEQVIDKLRRYEDLGIDYFCYMASYGLPMDYQKSSLKLFINEVMPAFQSAKEVAA